MGYWHRGDELNNGKFIVEELLGSGGFGVTYRVRQTRTNKLFALKTLNDFARSKPNFQELQAKFINEAISLASCRHSNIVRVYPQGFQEKELWCMVMEYIEGEDLSRHLDNETTLDMVKVPPGIFTMGTSDNEIEQLVKNQNDDWFEKESPQHEVTVPSFYFAKYPVTQKQWKIITNLPQIDRELNPEPSEFKGNNLPVENVSWDEAVEFWKRLSKATNKKYRLPSEAEWEYSCRAKTTTPFYFGDTITTELANYQGTYTYNNELKGIYREKTTPVDSFPSNPFGMYDMHGNVWEWCADTWSENYQGAPNDGSPWILDNDSFLYVARGGSWRNDPYLCRSTIRGLNYRDQRFPYIGFRVACVLP